MTSETIDLWGKLKIAAKTADKIICFKPDLLS